MRLTENYTSHLQVKLLEKRNINVTQFNRECLPSKFMETTHFILKSTQSFPATTTAVAISRNNSCSTTPSIAEILYLLCDLPPSSLASSVLLLLCISYMSSLLFPLLLLAVVSLLLFSFFSCQAVKIQSLSWITSLLPATPYLCLSFLVLSIYQSSY